MPPESFNPASFPSNSKHRLNLEVAAEAVLPVLLVRGARPGKTLVVSANVHGDEYEGVRAILEVFEELDPAAMAGDWIAAPVVNPPAFWAGTRSSPIDQANLARVFPGNPGGTVSERIAHHVGHALIARADLYLDLHSGGVKYSMPSMVGYYAPDPRGVAAALAFGAPVIWGHPDLAPGRTVSFAHDHQIPFLYTEARGAGRIHPDDLRMMKAGVRNLLRHLGILAGSPELPSVPPRRLHGNGNTDTGMAATRAGFLLNQVQLLDAVRAGQLLGRLVSPAGEPLEEYRAPVSGVVGMLREYPVVAAGDPLYLIADEIA